MNSARQSAVTSATDNAATTTNAAGDGRNMKRAASMAARQKWRQKKPSPEDQQQDPRTEAMLRRDPTLIESSSGGGQASSSLLPQLEAKPKRKTSIDTEVPTKRLRRYGGGGSAAKREASSISTKQPKKKFRQLGATSLRRKQTVIMAKAEDRGNSSRKQPALTVGMPSLKSTSTRAESMMSVGNEQSMMSLGNEISMMDTSSQSQGQDWPDSSAAALTHMRSMRTVRTMNMSIKQEPSFFGPGFDDDDDDDVDGDQRMASAMRSQEMSVREITPPLQQVKVEPGASTVVEDYEDCIDGPVPLWRARYSVSAGLPSYPSPGPGLGTSSQYTLPGPKSDYKRKLVVKLKKRAVRRHRPYPARGRKQEAVIEAEEAVPTSAGGMLVIKCEPDERNNYEQSEEVVMQRTGRKGRRPKNKGPPVCGECQKSFCSTSSLKRHLERKHTVYTTLPFSCSLCQDRFPRLLDLRSHERWHHRGGKGKTFPCQQCDVVFTRACHLKVHMRKHTNERPYTCPHPDCNSTFRCSSNLNRHMMKHSGLRPFQCTVCEADFYQASHLVSHIRKHTGERPFKCKECPATFTQLTHLHRHRSKHTGQKPHQCVQCGLGFVEKCALRRHLKTHTRKVGDGGQVLKVKLTRKTRKTTPLATVCEEEGELQ